MSRDSVSEPVTALTWSYQQQPIKKKSETSVGVANVDQHTPVHHHCLLTYTVGSHTDFVGLIISSCIG